MRVKKNNIYLNAHNGDNLENTSSFFENHHLEIIILLVFFYIFCKRMEFGMASIGIFGILTILIVLSNTNQLIYLMFLFTPMYLFVAIGTFPIYNVILGILLLRRLLKTSKNAFSPILAILLLMFIELVGMLFSGIGFSFNQIKFYIIIVVTTMHLFDPPKKYDNTEAVRYMIWGTFVFAVSYIVVNYNTIISTSIRTGGLGDLDPNTYALYNLFAIAMIILQLLSKQFNKDVSVKYIIIGVVLFIAGFMTLSKTYFLVTLVMIWLIFLTNIKKPKNILFAVAISVAVIVMVMSNAFLRSIYDAFMLRFETVTSFDELTTGRASLISSYITALKDNIIVLLFGSGMYSYRSILGIGGRPHNCTIEAVAAWGVLGSFTLSIMYSKGCGYYRRSVGYIGHIKKVNTVPLIILVVYMQSLTLLYQESTYAYIIMAIMLLFTKNVQNEKK